MMFNFENAKSIEDIYFHDCVYGGFSYDYDHREVRLELVHEWMKKRYSLCFQNVVALQVQGCGFWGGGNSVYYLWVDENPAYFHELAELQAKNPENYRGSQLDQGIRYVSITMQLHSGDELKITCESVDVTTENL